ncbi:MAG: hypothetical protein K5649_06775 [Lachnospiraceae bacterium]|nr:hypothetical protein [Lachnospiraceae bacterium]
MKKNVRFKYFLCDSLLLSILFTVVFAIPVHAYIDPSAATYLIQAIAGVVIALGAAIGIYVRRARKKLNDKLGIDENRNKEVESDDIVSKND